MTLADGSAVTGSHLLMAVGRQVHLDGLGLDAAGVAHDRKGVTVDAGLRSVSNRRVYAIGDVAGGLQFTHVAGYHAGIVIRQAVLGLPAKADHAGDAARDLYRAGTGAGRADRGRGAGAHGDALQVVRAEFAHNDRAIAEGTRQGSDQGDGRQGPPGRRRHRRRRRRAS